ncbi:hypothetical protein N7495_009490 [Penicillium taxi]|uniref:uncharacterized protein n=1 Tax=Penicillium taxi TaxID=168475 RepID=UPI002545B3AC|nr:uncharacterized protein N7495_009490 [Penicillium taxi]KAJ5884980.1 hypothetical protein N7495_009490 [Penicillium taxi]
MSSNKDMRRADLVIPYVDPPSNSGDVDMNSTMSSMMPMAAMFTRNRVSFVFSLQTWLAESPDQKNSASTPGYMSVGMAAMALGVTYLPLFMPPPTAAGVAAATPSPLPLA